MSDHNIISKGNKGGYVTLRFNNSGSSWLHEANVAGETVNSMRIVNALWSANGVADAVGSSRADMSELHQTNLVFHFRADTGITEATGVSAWLDQVSGSVTLAQGTAGAQPSYNATATVGTLANAGSMTFDGVDDTIYSTSVNIPAGPPNLIFCVLKPLAWTANDRFFAGDRADTSSAHVCQLGTSPQVVIQLGDYNLGPVDFDIDSWALLSTLWANSASTYLAKNDETPVTGDCGDTHMDTSFSLGCDDSAAGTPRNWGLVEVAELAIYDADKTGSDLTDIKDYFNDQYGLW